VDICIKNLAVKER